MSGSLFRRHFRRRAFQVSLATALVAGLTSVGVGNAAADGADPAESTSATSAPRSPVRMQTFDPEDFSKQAARLPAGLVSAVRRDLGISGQEYLAGAAAARLAGDVVAHLGATARSAWLEGQTLHVAVTDEDAAPAARATGAEVHIGDSLTDALAAARTQDKIAYIDREAGEIVPVDVGLRGEPVSEGGLIAQSTWQGGDGFAVSDLLADYRCSTGFTGTDDDGNASVLTAGHCASSDDGLFSSPVSALTPPGPIGASPELNESWPEHIGAEVGELDPESVTFGGGQDAGLIDITADDWQIAPEVTAPASSGGTTGETTAPHDDAQPADSTVDEPADGTGDEPADAGGVRILDSIDAIAGAPVCSSGMTSGWTCGTVLDASMTVPVSGKAVTGFLMDTCVLPGDSGGAVTVGQYALGINSGSTWRSSTCENGSNPDRPDGVSLGYAVTSGKDNVQTLYGDAWELAIHVGAPVITSPGEDSMVARTPTIAGRADAASGATVELTIDGEPTLTTKVDASGQWSIPVDEPLEPGSHDYEVVVSHSTPTGDLTVTSDPTTGSFEVAEVAGLTVGWPQPGDTTASHSPAFTGTGEPGASVTLSVDGENLATGKVGADGSWSLKPEDGLSVGRFDVVVTQQVDGESASVTVPDVGLRPEAPVITSPGPGEEVGTTHTFTGVGVVGATVSVRVRPDSSGAAIDTASDEPLQVRTDDEGIWEIQLDAPLPAGDQAVVATQTVDDLTSEPSGRVSFDVTEAQRSTRSMGDIGGAGSAEADLADTGSTTLPLLTAAAALLAAGLVVVVTRRRRTAR
ncbi:LPXTG cell wall anchor domain-containing protein [Haloactinopolyspora alba]|uniref:LPXTG cell wall anchor domain-containing protein n=1 Tax=Haloactinopolyspora alba TaxID=648780 RepID=UPI0013ED8403|nr:Ig-like domain-containing protein [Haloactinopolyspora alba]